jgi:nitrile hydratase subunit beta
MNGIHDMGGMDGFGPIVRETDEPVFHARWEGRVLAIIRALGAFARWNIDQFRDSIERLPPEIYLGSSYYKKWLLGLERRLVTFGLLTPDELVQGRSAGPAQRMPRAALTPNELAGRLKRGAFELSAPRPATFNAGDIVRTRNINPATHTRLPRYVRGHTGTIERIHGCHAFPDVAVLGKGEDPQWLYTVAFTARELWGADADPSVMVSVDAFEPYLERA